MTRALRWSVALALAWGLLAPSAFADQPTEVRIDIRSDQVRKIRIHEESLKETGSRSAPNIPGLQADEVLANDLDGSAVFTVSRAWSGAIPIDVQAVVGGEWNVSGGQVKLTGQIWDFPARHPILSREYRGSIAEWRSLLHRFADDVVLQFTGEPGVADTRIAFVGKQGTAKELYVMDADGARVEALTSDKSIASSPAWAPDGSLLLFTSYRSGHGPRVYVTPATRGAVYQVSARPGNNTSASYSPDGREIVCSLSQDGNPEIYALDARGGSPRRLTTNPGIDTSPAWSPTGREIAFTSDRSGSPQVYVMDRDGGNVRRLTFEVSYTDSPAWSPKGDQIAFVTRTSDGFEIDVCKADGSQLRRVVGGGSNENPHWSPDGRHLVFASNRDGAYGVYVSDLDGQPPRRIATGNLIASSPAWSPRPTGALGAGSGDRSP